CRRPPPARAGTRVTKRATRVVPIGYSAPSVLVRSPLTTSLPRRAARGRPESAHGARTGWIRLLFAGSLAEPGAAPPFLPSDGGDFEPPDGVHRPRRGQGVTQAPVVSRILRRPKGPSRGAEPLSGVFSVPGLAFAAAHEVPGR